jgi:hypothetical protein
MIRYQIYTNTLLSLYLGSTRRIRCMRNNVHCFLTERTSKQYLTTAYSGHCNLPCLTDEASNSLLPYTWLQVSHLQLSFPRSWTLTTPTNHPVANLCALNQSPFQRLDVDNHRHNLERHSWGTLVITSFSANKWLRRDPRRREGAGQARERPHRQHKGDVVSLSRIKARYSHTKSRQIEQRLTHGTDPDFSDFRPFSDFRERQ